MPARSPEQRGSRSEKTETKEKKPSKSEQLAKSMMDELGKSADAQTKNILKEQHSDILSVLSETLEGKGDYTEEDAKEILNDILTSYESVQPESEEAKEVVEAKTEPEEVEAPDAALDLSEVNADNAREKAGAYLASMLDEFGIEASASQKKSAELQIAGVLSAAADQAQKGYEGGVDPEERVRKITLEQMRFMTDDDELKEKITDLLEEGEGEKDTETPTYPDISLEANEQDEHYDKRIALAYLGSVTDALSDAQREALQREKTAVGDANAWMREMATAFSQMPEFTAALKGKRELGQADEKVRERLAKAAESFLNARAKPQKKAA